MSTHIQEYLLPEGTGPQKIRSLLATRYRFVEETPETVRRGFFDTFDWSAFLAGGSVEERVTGTRHQLFWHDLTAEGIIEAQDVDKAVGFASELPPGPLRDRLSAVLGERRLLPLVGLEGDRQGVRLLNEDEKTVARLVIEEHRLDGGTHAGGRGLPARLQVIPLRGYENAFAEIVELLSTDLGLAPARTPLLREALNAVGRLPGDYSSKVAYDLEPGERADATAKKILLGLLDTLEANIEGAKANLDAEFVHDLRVATRRTRCALSQIKHVFPSDDVDDYKKRFAWVQAVTGNVRDLDVYLLSFEGYQSNLPVQLQPHLEPLRAFLLAHYDEEQQAMVRALDSPHFRGLIEEWRAFLEAPVPERADEANALRPAKAVADACIWRLVRRVRREGRRIRADSPPEELHELRKSCKKLRYLMEFFQSLYPGDAVRDLVKQLKALLDNLGGFQDLSVQGRHLTEVAQRMRDEGGAQTETLLAMGALVSAIYTRRARARAEFTDLFAAYDAKENRRRSKALFAQPSGQDWAG